MRHVDEAGARANAEGFQSFAPGAAGQMLRTARARASVSFSGTGMSRPVFRSTPL